MRFLSVGVTDAHFVLCTDYNIIEEEEVPQLAMAFNQLHNEGVADEVSLRPVLSLGSDSSK